MCVARHAQITQNKTFAISMQYLRKEVINEVDFLHEGRHGNFLQIDAMILMGMVKHFQSSQNSKFAMSLQYVKKEVRDKVDFLHADKRQSFPQVDFISYKVILLLSMSAMKYSQSTQCNKFANLCNISEKKFGMQFIFCMLIKIKVSKNRHYRFWWKPGQTCPKYPK